MNSSTTYIAKQAKVSIEDAWEIQKTIDNNDLVDWSEDSYTKINKKIKLAQALIVNNHNWETLNVPLGWL